MSRQRQREEPQQVEEVEEVDEYAPVEIDQLQSLGVNVSDIKKLKLAGIYSLSGVLMHTMKELTEIKVRVRVCVCCCCDKILISKLPCVGCRA
jgi:hypothetical protein